MSLRRCVQAWIVATALVLPVALVGPATPAHADECFYEYYFLGMHGVGEGPSDTIPTTSIVIQETKDVFEWEMRHTYDKKAVGWAVSYASASQDHWYSFATITPAEEDGERQLRTAIEDQINTCVGRDPKFVLSGYSMGAWVIGNFLADKNNAAFLPRIKAVMLYGDPNRYRYPEGKTKGKTYYQGLAQWWGQRPTKNYPVSRERTLSICLEKDPVCGEGYPNTVGSRHDITRDTQTQDAAGCPATKCAHLKYVKDNRETAEQDGYGLTDLGGHFLAEFAATGHWSG